MILLYQPYFELISSYYKQKNELFNEIPEYSVIM